MASDGKMLNTPTQHARRGGIGHQLEGAAHVLLRLKTRRQHVGDQRQHVHHGQRQHIAHHHADQTLHHGHAHRDAKSTHTDQAVADEPSHCRNGGQKHQIAQVNARRVAVLSVDLQPGIAWAHQDIEHTLQQRCAVCRSQGGSVHGAMSLK
jgi:hypothetical protein